MLGDRKIVERLPPEVDANIHASASAIVTSLNSRPLAA